MTSRAVLTRVDDSMFGRMFGRCAEMLQPDPADGSVFIEGNGETFGLILDFLGGDPPDGPRMRRAMRLLPEAAQDSIARELDYFGLLTTVFGARPWTDEATFRPGPAMRDRRSQCAVVSAGGRVLVFGQAALLGNFTKNTTELIDAQTMASTAGPNLLAHRPDCAAVLLDADCALVVGGSSLFVDEMNLNTTEILHLSTLTLTPGPKLQSTRSGCAAVALDARRILVVGGQSDSICLSSTEILSLDTMVFTPGPAMAAPRQGCAVLALDEFRIMVAGGCSHPGRSLNTTEILDVRTMAFAPGPSMRSARWRCAALAVDAQHVLVLGGRDSENTPLATTELIDTVTMEFSPGPVMQARRAEFAAARLDTAQGPRILVVGGRDGQTKWTTEVLAAAAADAGE